MNAQHVMRIYVLNMREQFKIEFLEYQSHKFQNKMELMNK